jgi:NAD(P)-dependent dehydrogenase (short-subunit alcohol dehydrogenase family)
VNVRSALVTGAGGVGCGRAIARKLAHKGARVVVSDLDELGAHETARLIDKEGGRAIVRGCDVRISQDVDELVAFAARELGGLDLLVNNASAPFRPGTPLDFWHDTVITDLLGTMTATRAAIDVMRAQNDGRGRGAIVNIGSTSALGHGRRTRGTRDDANGEDMHVGGAPAYDVAKVGVMRLATMLAYLKKDGVRVNCLLPDWVATPAVQAFVDSVPESEHAAHAIPPRLTTMEQIADAVWALATDDSLAGRVMVWFSSDDAPKLIPFGDRGYVALDDV